MILQQVIDENEQLKTHIKNVEDTMWALDSQHKEYHQLHFAKIKQLESQLCILSIVIILRIAYELHF